MHSIQRDIFRDRILGPAVFNTVVGISWGTRAAMRLQFDRVRIRDADFWFQLDIEFDFFDRRHHGS